MSTEDREDTCRIQRAQLLSLLDLTTVPPAPPPPRQMRKRMPTIELAIDRATPHVVDTTLIDRMLDAAIDREIETSLVDVEIDNAFETITTVHQRPVNSTVDVRPVHLLIALAICFCLGISIMAFLT
jgi:hypothetical protein